MRHGVAEKRRKEKAKEKEKKKAYKGKIALEKAKATLKVAATTAANTDTERKIVGCLEVELRQKAREKEKGEWIKLRAKETTKGLR